MKAILISIKPKWVAKILNGEKTIEIRKTMPKCDLPIDVYIYCTRENIRKTPLFVNSRVGNGKVVAKFTLNKVEEIEFEAFGCDNLGDYEYKTKTLTDLELCDKSCLIQEKINQYLCTEKGYAWHIDKLEIFDKPKELSEFYKLANKETEIVNEGGWYVEPVTKAPQNYCYVEVML